MYLINICQAPITCLVKQHVPWEAYKEKDLEPATRSLDFQDREKKIITLLKGNCYIKLTEA